MPELERLAADGGLGLLEDACEALGARDSEGRAVGSRGNLASFAFYANKQLTTGEGGMLAVSDPELAARLRSERNQGRAPDMGWVDHDRLGFNYRLTEVQAALGVAQLERLDELLAERARAAALYTERLAALDYGAPGRARAIRRGWCCPAPTAAPSAAAGSSTPCGCPAAADRDAVLADLAQRGVEAKAYMPAHPPDGALCASASASARASSRSPRTPRRACSRCRSSPAIAEQQIDRVCEALAEALRGDWT